MRVYSIQVQNRKYNPKEKLSVKRTDDTKTVRRIGYTEMSSVYFTGIIPPSKRLQKSDYLISGYISEIGKARNFYGDRAVVDLSMGNPDLTPPEKAKEALKLKVNDLWSHRYNNPKGESVFLSSVSEWMKNRFGVDVNPKTEAMATSGSSDAVDHIFSAFADRGDKVLVPNPGYSLYDDLITRHDLVKTPFDLFPENGYLPDFSKMPKDAKILILNYPHNPTGSFAPFEMYEQAVKWAKDTGTLIIHDMDNSEITHSGIKPASIMQVDGAKDVAFQVHTFSKAQSMPGFRVAFVVSDKENIDNLLNAKYLSGGSVYVPVQHAAAAALKDEEGFIPKVNQIYRERKNTAIDALHRLGSDAEPTEGTYYLWTKVPPEFTSDEFFKYVLHKSQVAFTPGTVFGTNGEGYVRMVMSAPKEKIEECFNRIEKAGIRFDVPKTGLSEETQEEIKKFADGSFIMPSKADRDYEEYMNVLDRRRKILELRYRDKAPTLGGFIPKEFDETNKLPWNILKDGQSVYVQDVQYGRPMFAQIHDITPYSDDSEYINLLSDVDTQWYKKDLLKTEKTLNSRPQEFNRDNYYIALKTDDGRLEAIGTLRMQQDGSVIGDSINLAPWNKGDDAPIKGCEDAVIARMMSLCLESGIDSLKLKINSSSGILAEKDKSVLTFNNDEMKKYLSKYQGNLSF